MRTDKKNGDECIIVDLDGTLAILDHRIHHIQKEKKDFNNFFAEMGNDKPREGLRRIIQIADDAGIFIFIFTARPIEYLKKTLEWLNGNSIPFDQLYMRENKIKSDIEIKREMLQKMEKRWPKMKIISVFDDRSRVVDYWRSEGIECYQVNQWKEYDQK